MVHQQTVDTSAAAIKLGSRFVLHATDAGMLQRAVAGELNELRKVAGKSAGKLRNTVDVV